MSKENKYNKDVTSETLDDDMVMIRIKGMVMDPGEPNLYPADTPVEMMSNSDYQGVSILRQDCVSIDPFQETNAKDCLFEVVADREYLVENGFII